MGSSVATLPVVAYQQRLRRAIRENVDRVIFTSELSRAILGNALSYREGIVLNNFVPRITTSQGSTRAEPYFVVLGRLSLEKGVEDLIHQWPKTQHLLVLGDGPERSKLEAISHGKTIEFHGYVAQAERDRLLVGASALILPSVTMEADPVVVAQALSAGTPCIVKKGTASSQWANVSPAVLTYQDGQSLSEAVARMTKWTPRAEAKALYQAVWSEDAWLRNYRDRVIEPLVSGA